MIFSLVVLSAPYSQESSYSALRFAKTLLAEGHSIHRVFFYGDGVQNASRLAAPPQDETNLPEQWKSLSQAANIELVVCIAAALRRGIIDEREAARYQKDTNNLLPPFEISGLGQLLEAAVVSDRLITFGS